MKCGFNEMKCGFNEGYRLEKEGLGVDNEYILDCLTPPIYSGI